jgi:hypothetical protein
MSYFGGKGDVELAVYDHCHAPQLYRCPTVIVRMIDVQVKAECAIHSRIE